MVEDNKQNAFQEKDIENQQKGLWVIDYVQEETINKVKLKALEIRLMNWRTLYTNKMQCAFQSIACKQLTLSTFELKITTLLFTDVKAKVVIRVLWYYLIKITIQKILIIIITWQVKRFRDMCNRN